MLLLDGKATAATLRAALKEEIAALTPEAGRAPGLAVLLVGDDPASQVYVRNKERACAEAGIRSVTYRLPADTRQSDLEHRISQLNVDDEVDGILLQLPLPVGLKAQPCLEAISPRKDVDGLHPDNQGRLAMGLPGLRPCTPAGVMALLRHYGLSVDGQKAVVVGRSNLVGRPLALMLGSRENNATVTMCHSGTRHLADECRQADFLFTALGKPRFITADMVKEGAVVVDIGINRQENALCGDVDFEAVSRKASALTPVPGGIGPMTISQLLANTAQAWKRRNGLL
ncbi:MAG TPA: bifunctional methylenetetrahydrofolate dehydrogenase/methenyltetrahydrofolate cyclohydrolase FolD [Candidatus Mailhella merdigallinarum]|uniref:Bifunctional protein FolD n=1 Tax=Candidatus Mailhella merdigallinarum TaxID=2838658 RepID=A0A9D2KL35_9BACT|nr:bifunctional methylenetetrahydrofolate dehydrogenase/methenyltetrahydrofolate cyclohydrolase FolD [Desulfovibrionaceae bacterium]HJA09524.1 bifunctional methylenetetrahydrofolate dehydrogenase/methenyltetrahydrofolate cyclohydrolase FolD [Candidatus Mailhella merdigallinarum]